MEILEPTQVKIAEVVIEVADFIVDLFNTEYPYDVQQVEPTNEGSTEG